MRRYLLTAMMGHLVILAGASLYWLNHPQKEVSVEKIYFYSALSHSSGDFKKSERVVKTVEKGILNKSAIKKATQYSSTLFNPEAKNSDDKLLALLHEKIAAAQQYPENAITLNQTGTVTIGLVLHPDGAVSQVSMIKSSGIESLDSAALTAVQSIKILEAGLYLKSEKYFSVDVVFSL
jgi:TonB family protein